MLSALSAYRDLASCSRCGGVRSVSFGGFLDRMGDRPYRSLLAFHLRQHDPEQLREGLQAALAGLPGAVRPEAVSMAEAWRAQIAEVDLEGVSTADVARHIAAEARRRLEATGVAPGDDLYFDFFEAVTLTCALRLGDDPELRDRLGIAREGWLDRYRWNVVAAGALLLLLALARDPLWITVLWVGLGLSVLPPLARTVASRMEGTGEGHG